MPFNEASKKTSSLTRGLKSIAGFSQKAVIEIGDMSSLEVKKRDAQKPSAGAGAGTLGSMGKLDTGTFSMSAVSGYATAMVPNKGDEEFDLYGHIKKYRFECQFNPDELYINGYGGEELPVQKYRSKEDKPEGEGQGEGEKKKKKKDDDPDKVHGGSTMAAPNTRIDMSFKIVFDKSNPQDAFYSDKFTLSQTNIGKGVARGIMKAAGKMSNSVQPEVEALTAVVRSGNKRLCRFVWGDMAYEGVLNNVNAEYVMFNPNGEPVRAFVSLSMVLYDEEVAGANTDIWQREYMKDFYSLKDPTSGFTDLII